MRTSWGNERMGWPVLLSLLLFLGVAAYLVWRSDASQAPVTGGATIGAVEPTVERSDADTWRRHAWTSDAGAGEAADRRERPAERGYDPQRTAMERAFDGPVDGGGLPFAPVRRAARLVSQEGLAGSTSDACEVRVLPARSGPYDCLVRVTCGSTVLYPNPSQTGGYVTCRLEDGRPVGVEDRGHTALDGDPRLTLDLRAGTVEVEDLGDGVEPYRASLRLEDR